MTAYSTVAMLVAERVKAEGPISFADYMQIALYSDPLGYYRRNVPGPGADYRTSPTLSPVFGRLVCRQLARMWEAIGHPREFRVTEPGGGNGALAACVLESAPASFLRTVKWCFVEPFPSVERVQREALARHPFADRVEWVADLNELQPAVGVVIANEVLDNFPVHVLEVAGGALHEIRVGIDGTRLAEVRGPVVSRPWHDRVRAALDHLEPGDRLEICPKIESWCRLAASSLRRGHLLVVDYGDPEPDIWLRHPAGTVVTYRDEQLGFDPLEHPGDADITAGVNFSALSRAAAGSGLTVGALMSQRDWLRSLGLPGIEDDLRQEQRLAEQRGDHAAALGLLAERSRAAALGYKGGLGDLLVWTAAKDAPPVPMRSEGPALMPTLAED